ncbi:hypothetical protein APC1461_1242 [Bifidobacterium longum]|uniref:Uncharacterized protein n=1 Tax=Bifidobacterium longum TaxID=216816 RepID=A0A2N0TIK6_BIFLN|nr:hypothetical protein [Bifidobacterium longum]PKD14584.1 hypothetical protein APC1461_1242 [Bifidobacterium longum]
MKKKTGIYLVIGIVGIALALSARLLLQDSLSDSQSGAMIGIGAGLFGYGIAKWCVALWGAKNPDLMKINEIEEKDERNQLIRNKAQAISGEVLNWLLMAGAWVCVFSTHPYGLFLLL